MYNALSSSRGLVTRSPATTTEYKSYIFHMSKLFLISNFPSKLISLYFGGLVYTSSIPQITCNIYVYPLLALVLCFW